MVELAFSFQTIFRYFFASYFHMSEPVCVGKEKKSFHLSFHQMYANEHVLHVIYIFHESLLPQNISRISTTTYIHIGCGMNDFQTNVESKLVKSNARQRERSPPYMFLLLLINLKLIQKIIYCTIRFGRLELTLNWAGVEHADILMTDSPIKFQRKKFVYTLQSFHLSGILLPLALVSPPIVESDVKQKGWTLIFIFCKGKKTLAKHFT